MLYLIRRHLHFSRAEWESLPWHDQIMYLEGLQDEFYEHQEEEDLSDSDSLTSLGAQVRKIEAKS